MNECVRVAVVLSAWMAVSLVTLEILDLFSSDRYFIISYVGLLSIMHVYAPVDSRPRWWTVLRWVSVLGFLIFMLIIYQRIIVVL